VVWWFDRVERGLVYSVHIYWVRVSVPGQWTLLGQARAGWLLAGGSARWRLSDWKETVVDRTAGNKREDGAAERASPAAKAVSRRSTVNPDLK